MKQCSRKGCHHRSLGWGLVSYGGTYEAMVMSHRNSSSIRWQGCNEQVTAVEAQFLVERRVVVPFLPLIVVVLKDQ